jgi:hypothetical protein
MVVAAVFLNGATAASLGPFTSLLAIEVFGLSNAGLSAVLALASVIGVSAAISVGIVTDQRANRRRVAVASGMLMSGGGLLVLGGNSALAFILAHALVLPAARTLNGQLFALARLAASVHPPDARDAITAAVRTAFALPFVVILPLWAAAFPLGVDLRAVYVAPLIGGALTALMLWRFWPQDGTAPWADPRSGLRFGAALREVLHLRLLARVALIGVVVSGSYMNLVTMGLVFRASRDAGDVALFAALVALIEMPAMLAAPLLTARFGRPRAIAGAAAVFAVFLAVFPFAAPYPVVWLFALPFALSQGVTLSAPIAYLQDLIGSRPGAGSALIAVNSVVTHSTVAVIFAMATAVAGYWLADVLSAVAILAAAALLVAVERQR